MAIQALWLRKLTISLLVSSGVLTTDQSWLPFGSISKPPFFAVFTQGCGWLQVISDCFAALNNLMVRVALWDSFKCKTHDTGQNSI